MQPGGSVVLISSVTAYRQAPRRPRAAGACVPPLSLALAPPLEPATPTARALAHLHPLRSLPFPRLVAQPPLPHRRLRGVQDRPAGPGQGPRAGDGAHRHTRQRGGAPLGARPLPSSVCMRTLPAAPRVRLTLADPSAWARRCGSPRSCLPRALQFVCPPLHFLPPSTCRPLTPSSPPQAPGIVPTKFSAALVADAALEQAQAGRQGGRVGWAERRSRTHPRPHCWAWGTCRCRCSGP
jgi:hypothetical protein